MPINGNRYYGDLVKNRRYAIYWNDPNSCEIRRCLWFYKESDLVGFLPYDDEFNQFLEENYNKITLENAFSKRVFYRKEDKDVETFTFYSPTIIMHSQDDTDTINDEFSDLNGANRLGKEVKRGIQDVQIKMDDDETDKIDHLCFVIHGIGEGCDLKFRPLVDCVNDMRSISTLVTKANFKSSYDDSKIGRIEYIPVTWHEELHKNTQVDDRLADITLDGIPKLRKFANSTMLDILFYTSPVYCQTIINKVANEMNRMFRLFIENNKEFNGKISIIGHSLGSLISFDLLTHQPHDSSTNESLMVENFDKLDLNELLKSIELEEYISLFEKEKINGDNILFITEDDLKSIGIPLGHRKQILNALSSHILKRSTNDLKQRIRQSLSSCELSDAKNNIYKYGQAGTGQLFIKYPKLEFNVDSLYALGSPIGAFLTVRGIESLGVEFKLPKCNGFFNIFHPYDPVAYRIEPLVNPKLKDLKPVLMPHHLGRKRLHLEIKDNITKVSEDLRQKMMFNFKKTLKTWNATWKSTSMESIEANESSVTIEQDINDEIIDEKQDKKTNEGENDFDFGMLNNGQRVDYVLQESPIESFNEYLSTYTSHTCYWQSLDTMLFIVKEIYTREQIFPDSVIELAAKQQQQQQQQQGDYLQQVQASSSIAQATASKIFSFFTQNLPRQFTGSQSSLTTATSTETLINEQKN